MRAAWQPTGHTILLLLNNLFIVKADGRNIRVNSQGILLCVDTLNALAKRNKGLEKCVSWYSLGYNLGRVVGKTAAFTEAMQSEWHHITSPLRIAESKSTELDTFTTLFRKFGWFSLLTIQQTRDFWAGDYWKWNIQGYLFIVTNFQKAIWSQNLMAINEWDLGVHPTQV